MELLLRFGNTEQQQKYLLPLLKGETRSCFAMTEPNTASSNPTQIQTTITGKQHIQKSSLFFALQGGHWMLVL
jgi:alkylation response protein AidB-like acyl-CoA dehydrogenase